MAEEPGPGPSAMGGGGSTEPDTMEAVLDLSPEEARTYSMILDAASTLPKNDPRFALTLTFTWWLLHRRRRLEQQRVRRRQFYRRLRRLIFLRWHLKRNTLSGAAVTSAHNNTAVRENIIVPSLREKRLWVRTDRNEDFWTKVDQNLISAEAFRKYFHMSRETFDYVYDELAEQLQKTNTTMRDSLSGKKRLAATIYRMATNAEYIKVSSLFGIGKSTTTSLVRDVCEIIVANLKDEFITFIGEGVRPQELMKRRIDEAAGKFGIPRVIGILGSVDVMIIGSSWDWSENSPYISSYHKNYAVTFQAVVDADRRFSHVCAGSPSSLTNKQILEGCGLKEEFARKFNPVSEESEQNQEQQVRPTFPARIVADESYGSKDPSSQESTETENQEQEPGPSSRSNSTSTRQTEPPEWLLTPEEVEHEVQDDNEQQLLLEKITQARDFFDDAVFNVKSRWKIFHGKNGKINFSADAFEKIALACCILHNICEIQGDGIDPSWGADIGPEVYNRNGYPKEFSGDEEAEEFEEYYGEEEDDGREENMEDSYGDGDAVDDENAEGVHDESGDAEGDYEESADPADEHLKTEALDYVNDEMREMLGEYEGDGTENFEDVEYGYEDEGQEEFEQSERGEEMDIDSMESDIKIASVVGATESLTEDSAVTESEETLTKQEVITSETPSSQ